MKAAPAIQLDVERSVRKKDLIRRLKKYRLLYIFIIPVFVQLLIFNYGPMAGLVVVFQDYNPLAKLSEIKWVGFENFRLLFLNPKFGQAMRNTIVISLLKLVFVFPAPIILSLMLNELRMKRLKKTIQTLVYIPNFVSWVVVAGFFYSILSNSGVVNRLLMTIGLTDAPIPFFQYKSFFYPIIILTDIWKTVGYSSIFYMSAIATIPQEQYEAAQVDGAGRWKQMIHITLPSIKGTISLLLIMQVAGLLNAGFDQLWTMSNLAVKEIAEIIDTAVLTSMQTGSARDYSIGAAFGLFKSLISVALFFIANFAVKKMGQESVV